MSITLIGRQHTVDSDHRELATLLARGIRLLKCRRPWATVIENPTAEISPNGLEVSGNPRLTVTPLVDTLESLEERTTR